MDSITPHQADNKDKKNQQLSFPRKQFNRLISSITPHDTYEVATWFVVGLTLTTFGVSLGLSIWWLALIALFALIPEAIWVVLLKRKQQQPAKRPEISLRMKFGDLVVGQNMGMEFEAHNVGDAAAINFGMHLSYKTYVILPDDVPTQFREVLEWGQPTVDFGGAEKILPDGKAYIKPIRKHCPTLTPVIASGAETLFVYGLYWFEDESGKNVTTERFCRIFNPREPADPFNCPGRVRQAMVEQLPHPIPPVRPELSIDLTRTSEVEGIPQMGIQLRNGGNLAAHNFRAAYWHYHRLARDSKKRLPMPPPMSVDLGTMPVIAPGVIFSIFLTADDLPPAIWKRVQQGHSELFLFLKVTYTDEAGNPFGFDRCFRYSRSEQRLFIAPQELWSEGFNFNS